MGINKIIKPKAYRNTKVNYVKSQMQINKLLNDNGIYDLQHTLLKDEATITFLNELTVEGKRVKVGVKVKIPVGDEKDRDQIYRALFHYLKAKFESLTFGFIEEYNEAFVKEFLPHVIVDKTGKTIYDVVIPNLNKALGYTHEGEQLYLSNDKVEEETKKESYSGSINADYEVKE